MDWKRRHRHTARAEAILYCFSRRRAPLLGWALPCIPIDGISTVAGDMWTETRCRKVDGLGGRPQLASDPAGQHVLQGGDQHYMWPVGADVGQRSRPGCGALTASRPESAGTRTFDSVSTPRLGGQSRHGGRGAAPGG